MATKTETHLELLKRMQVRIKDAIFSEDCPPRDLASLSRRLQDISKEIEAIEERLRLEGASNGSSASRRKGKFNPDNV